MFATISLPQPWPQILVLILALVLLLVTTRKWKTKQPKPPTKKMGWTKRDFDDFEALQKMNSKNRRS